MKNRILFLESDITNMELFNIIKNSVMQKNYLITSIDQDNKYKNIETLNTAISQSTLVVVDISNSSNDIAVGQIFSQKKPVIFIANTRNRISTYLSNYSILIYNINSFDSFVKDLMNRIIMITKEIEINENKALEISIKSKKRKVFISNCHKDKKYMERILIHLKPLEKNGSLDIWVDTMIKTGELWKKEVEKSLSSAEVGILLISADYLASDFIIDNELPPLLVNAQKNGTTILPIVVKPCRFLRDKNLNVFQSINNPENPLCSLNEKAREEVYERLSKEVEELVDNT